jgi:hypothetical protein
VVQAATEPPAKAALKAALGAILGDTRVVARETAVPAPAPTPTAPAPQSERKEVTNDAPGTKESTGAELLDPRAELVALTAAVEATWQQVTPPPALPESQGQRLPSAKEVERRLRGSDERRTPFA